MAVLGVIGYLMLRRAIASFVDDVDDRPRDRRDIPEAVVCENCAHEYRPAWWSVRCPKCRK